MPREDETPPWHPYDGCYGCREAEKINRRASRTKDATATPPAPDPPHHLEAPTMPTYKFVVTVEVDDDHPNADDAEWWADAACGALGEYGGTATFELRAADNTDSVKRPRVEEGEATDALRKLLTDWFDGQLTKISEFSSNTYNDWQRLIEDAKARHETFGLPWDDSFVPDYVRESLAYSSDD